MININAVAVVAAAGRTGRGSLQWPGGLAGEQRGLVKPWHALCSVTTITRMHVATTAIRGINEAEIWRSVSRGQMLHRLGGTAPLAVHIVGKQPKACLHQAQGTFLSQPALLWACLLSRRR